MGGLLETSSAVAGAEPAESTPSQIPWFKGPARSVERRQRRRARAGGLIYTLSVRGGNFGTGLLAPEGLLPTLEAITPG